VRDYPIGTSANAEYAKEMRRMLCVCARRFVNRVQNAPASAGAMAAFLGKQREKKVRDFEEFL